MRVIQCAICGNKERQIELYKENLSKGKITAYTFSARRVPDRMHYRIVKCVRCGLIFSNPIFSSKKISGLYKESKFTYGTEAEFLKKTYAEFLREILPEIGRNKINLLEVGCGNGFFLEEALKMGVKNVFGIEPSRDSINSAVGILKKKIKRDILRPGIFKSGTFDIVCFFHTLDHAINPNDFLITVKNLLKKNGKVICVIHNTDGISVKLFRERSPIFDIEHIYLFNKKTIARIFRKNGFKQIKITDLKNKYPLIYWLKLMPLPETFKRGLTAFFSFIRIGQVSITFKAGNMVIIASK